jgi:hypothetical protein
MLKLKITRLERNTKLVVPHGYYASVLLKLVNRVEGQRQYSWWLTVGRHDMDSVSVPYRYTGEDTIRFDLPPKFRLSKAALRPHLTRFLRNAGELEGDPPIIIED